MAGIDTSTPARDTVGGDPRNVGLWAKKRARELGVDVGADVDAAVEKARSRKPLDDI
jgi:hypothetical protein